MQAPKPPRLGTESQTTQDREGSRILAWRDLPASQPTNFITFVGTAVTTVAVGPVLCFLAAVVVVISALVEQREQAVPLLLPDGEKEKVKADPREELQNQVRRDKGQSQQEADVEKNGPREAFASPPQIESAAGFWAQKAIGCFEGDQGAEHAVREEQQVPRAELGKQLAPVGL
ncbi:hypothetical protein PG984_008984 [Apiospora sp. TS-2023a]